MSLQYADLRMSQEDYLSHELQNDVKHELIDGELYAMSGASRNHERLATTIISHFGNHLEGQPCEVFSSDMKVKAGKNFFYPDVMVVCDDEEGDDYFTE